MVEDNIAHLQLTQKVLQRNHVNAKIYVTRDGEEALDFLYARNDFTSREQYPLPDIILLDLNLPKRDGREVLMILKNDPGLKDIPVVIVSTSDREEDMAYASQNGAIAYISKSAGFDRFNDELSKVTKYARLK